MPMYLAYETTRSLAAPVNAWAAALRAFWSDAALPATGTPLGRAVAGAAELLERATRRYPKPAFALESTRIGGRRVPVCETTALRTPFCDLLHFERDVKREDPRVLLVAPLSGHHATLLRDTVAALLPDHDVWLTDWTDARLVPPGEGRFDLDDYVDLVARFLHAVGPGAHLVSVCQPAVAVLAAASLLCEDLDAAAPHTMTIMGGPVDARVHPTAPCRLAASLPLAWFERTLVHAVPAGERGAGRRVYPGFLQLSAFLSMNPERHAGAQLRLAQHLTRGDDEGARRYRRFYDEYLAVMDVPAEYYLQTVARVFQRHELARGELRYRDVRPVRPAAIRDVALMTVEGEDDDITGVGQTFAAHALCTGVPPEKRCHHLQRGVGHFGLFSGRRWREEIAPRVRDFIRGQRAPRR